ncbi:MAG: YbaN family protein [Ignavibacteria bacterium]|nr:YbaN family protein [Ignavibacteria bacterium]
MNEQELNISKNKLKRGLFITIGFIMVGIGTLGIFLPVLPSTVFFLMAAYLFARSSEKFYIWLHENKLFGRQLKNYREGRGMSIKTKVVLIVLLWISILISVLFAVENYVLKFILIVILFGVTVYLVRLKTGPAEN